MYLSPEGKIRSRAIREAVLQAFVCGKRQTQMSWVKKEEDA